MAPSSSALLAAMVVDASSTDRTRGPDTSREHRDADKGCRTLLAKAGDRHLVDRDGYGWQWDFADACITDISAVAYDWLTSAGDHRARPRLPPTSLLDTLLAAGAGRRGWPDPRIASRRRGSNSENSRTTISET